MQDDDGCIIEEPQFSQELSFGGACYRKERSELHI